MKVKSTRLGKGLVTAATLAALTVGFSSQANAGAVIFANILMDNLSLTATNDLGDVDLDFATVVLDGENSSTFDNNDPVFGDSAPPGTAIDPLQACFASDGLNGTGCPGQNDFSPQAVIGDQFSRGDSVTTNNLLDGNASVSMVTEIQLNSTVQNNTAQTFVNLSGVVGEGPGGQNDLTNNTQLTLAFDADAILNGFLHDNAVTVSGGSVSIEAQFTVRDDQGNIVANWVPGGVATGLAVEIDPTCDSGQGLGTTSISIDDTLVRSDSDACSGSWLVTTDALPNGRYQISLLLRVDASLRATKAAVPEPSALLLMGVGLLGLGAVARRRKAA